MDYSARVAFNDIDAYGELCLLSAAIMHSQGHLIELHLSSINKRDSGG